MKRKADYEVIIMASYRLIQAMLVEASKMPKEFDAPKTMDAVGVLRVSLEAIGIIFTEGNT